jgi:hypothetical protein
MTILPFSGFHSRLGSMTTAVYRSCCAAYSTRRISNPVGATCQAEIWMAVVDERDDS